MKRHLAASLSGIGLTLLLIGGCAGSATPTAAPEDPAPTMAAPTESPTPTPAPSVVDPPLPTPQVSDEEMMLDPVIPASELSWAADGVIGEGEYEQQIDFGRIRLWWTNDDTWLFIALEGDTEGWVAVGIDPERGMQGANYLFGYVADGEASLWDAYGTAPVGPNHPPDEDLDGTSDIVTYAGVEENGVTRFEAQIPLDSGDAYDKALVPGNSYPVIVAIGPQDDYNSKHTEHASSELTLQ